MHPASREKLQEMQQIISKIPLNLCWATVLPEFGVQWRQVARAVRNNRLPMIPVSVARVLSRHAAKSIPEEELDEIVARLRLKLVATQQDRKWFVIDLLEPIEEDASVAELIDKVPGRVANALRRSRKGQTMTPEVLAVHLGDLLYLSVRLVAETGAGSVGGAGGALYAAWPGGERVALVSALARRPLLTAVAQGLGYKSFEDTQLYGKDIKSLLRIHNRHHNENVDHLVSLPEYNPTPVITTTGVDFTHQAYNNAYVENLLGPDPPLLTELTIASTKPFFDRSRIDKTMKITVKIQSEDIAKTLRSWAAIGAVAPTSDFFHIFHKVKSNKIMFDNEENND